MRTSLRRESLSLALALASFACAKTPPPTTAAGGPQPTRSAISAEDLKARLYVYAADSMMGRKAGTRGNARATDYLAAEARRSGLEPAGENGSYFQAVPMQERALDPRSAVDVEGATLRIWRDFAPFPPQDPAVESFSPHLAREGAQAIYGGRVGDSTAMISAEQAAGKLVVLAAPLGPDGKPDWRFWLHGSLERFRGTEGVAIATLDLSPLPILEFLRQPQTVLAAAPAPVHHSGDQPVAPLAMLVTADAAARLMGGRLDGLRPGAAGRTIRATVRFANGPTEAPARNVVAILRGSDPKLRGEYVALGAHNDHIGVMATGVDHDSLRAFNRILRPEGAGSPPRVPTPSELEEVRASLDSLRAVRPARRDSIANGADDDGSGSVSVLGIAQALASARESPKRSILFVWHTGEEEGLFGSQWFTDHPTVPRDSIIAQLNIDMIGRGGPDDIAGGGPGYLQLIGTRRLSTELGDLVEAVNARGKHGFTFDYRYDAVGHPENYYCRSDHYMYARYGIPIAFFTTGSHRDYHQVTDEPQYIDYDHLARIARLIGDIALAVANLDHRLVVDKPKPDPNAPCQQ